MRGVITSPNYPDTYPNNIECVWTIHPPRNRGVLLLMPNISLPLTSDCSHYLTMRGDASPYSTTTYYACESYDQPVAVISRSKSLFIKFSARGHGTAEGFKIFYVTFEGMWRPAQKPCRSVHSYDASASASISTRMFT